MSTPHSKRRRVDSISTGIHKPFVSPLKRASTNTNTNTNTSESASPQQQQQQQQHTPLRTSKLRNTSTPTTSPPTDPEILTAHQAIRTLETRIRDLRGQNAILEHANSLRDVNAAHTSPQQQQQQQPRPSKLELKWRRASQAAAEKVFGDFSARIRDHGGYTAFLKQQRRGSRGKAFADQDGGKEGEDMQGDEEDWRDEMGDALTERGRKQRRRENEERGRRNEERGRRTEEEDEDEDEDEAEQELTLGSMLQVLNIPPEVIGWDEKEQGWK